MTLKTCSYRPTALAGLLLLAACSAGGSTPPSDEPVPPTVAYAEGAVPERFFDAYSGLHAQVVELSFSGELCPEWSSVDNPPILSGDGIGQAVFKSKRAPTPCAQGAAPPECPLEPSCTVTAVIEVPPGYRMGMPTVTWKGAVTSNPSSTSASRSYNFAGGDSASTPEKTVELGPAGAFSLVDRALSGFSRTCESEQTVRFTAALHLRRGSPDTIIALDSAIIDTGSFRGARFETCEGGQEGGQAAPLAKKGQLCGGPSHRECEQSLICETSQAASGTGNSMWVTTEEPSGLCVDLDDQAKPSTQHNSCGGPRQIPCVAGLVCWHAQGAEPSSMGTCVTEKASLADPCHTGTPALECADGLRCSAEYLYCVAGGEEGDNCLDLTSAPCQPPFYCGERGTCTRAQGAEGEPCWGSYAPCQGDAYCDEIGICAMPPSDFEGCNEWNPCPFDESCVDGACVPSSWIP